MNLIFHLQKPIIEDMQFVEVLVASAQYHGKRALTYHSVVTQQVGGIVSVPLQEQFVLGIVVKIVPKPSFKTREIVTSYTQLPSITQQSLDLLQWLSDYYPAPLGVITQLFLPKSLSKKLPTLSPLVGLSPAPLPLTKEQRVAVDAIRSSGLHILHGETGSGKTRVYLALAEKALHSGRSAFILSPEIGLTSQLAQNFQSRFGERVIVIHSKLTESERQRAWLYILNTKEPLVIIGARSALFSPARRIGLIVIDEAHDNSYKQDQAPHYHATRVAAKLGQLHKAPVILGTATPLVGDYFLAEQKSLPILRMQKLARGTVEYRNEVSVVDLKDRHQFSQKPFLSKILIEKIQQTLNKKEQTLLFLNRRGTARVVFCDRCSWQADCPHCDIPLVYHGDDHVMRCHTCSFRQSTPSSCPECGNPSIIFKSIGTKAIAEEIASLFPEASIRRFDTDNKRGERIERQYEAIKNGEVDIIVGTQTIAKGLDLPKLGLVGVIVADTSLYLPDYNSEERTYQLLAQVIGRVGRGHRHSQAVIQTYDPQSPLVKSVIARDWYGFYQKELQAREAFLFPPYCYILKLTCRRATAAAARQVAEKLATELEQTQQKIVVEGPAPSFHEKVANKYQWQLILKAKNRSELLAVIAKLPSGWNFDIDPTNLL